MNINNIIENKMKKIFIALSMMVIPLTAHAQSGGEKVV